MKTATILSGMLITSLLASAQPSRPADTSDRSERSAIVQLLQEFYIRGLYVDRDVAVLRADVHPECTFVMIDGHRTYRYERTAMLHRVQECRKATPAPRTESVDATIRVLDIDGGSAIARVNLAIAGIPVTTELVSLLRTADGWKIVSRVARRQG